MAQFILIPELNPIHFVVKNQTLPNGVNQPYSGTDTFFNEISIPSRKGKYMQKGYAQKVQQSDKISIQVQTAINTGTVTLNVYEVHNMSTVVYTSSLTSIAITGNNYDYNGVDIALTTWYNNVFSPTSAGITNGFYVFELVFDDGIIRARRPLDTRERSRLPP